MSRTRLEELVWRKNLMRGNLSDVNADHLRYALRCYDQAWGLEPEPVLVNLAVHSDLYSFMERARLVELVAPLGLYQGCSHRGIFRVSRERMRFDLRRLLPPPVVAVNLPQLGDVLVPSISPPQSPHKLPQVGAKRQLEVSKAVAPAKAARLTEDSSSDGELISLGQLKAKRDGVPPLPFQRPLSLQAAAVGAPQTLQGRHGEVLYPFPETASLGPGNDAWVDYVQRKNGGVTYRSFKSTDRLYSEWSEFGFPSDGSHPYNFNSGQFSKRSTQNGYRSVYNNRTDHTFNVHIAVAYLFGAPKKTGYQMSLLLVVDHIVEGDKTNFRLDNLQIVTVLQNLAKASNINEVAKGKGAVLLPDGNEDGKGWFGELTPLYAFPDEPTLGLHRDAWVDYVERTHLGVTYRSFTTTDRMYSEWYNFGFPSDGSHPYNFKSGRFSALSTTTDGYRIVARMLTTISGAKTVRHFMNHIAVAYLFGAPKITDMPMSLILVVDHIREGNKADFRLGNLQIATQLQNVQKGNGVADTA